MSGRVSSIYDFDVIQTNIERIKKEEDALNNSSGGAPYHMPPGGSNGVTIDPNAPTNSEPFVDYY